MGPLKTEIEGPGSSDLLNKELVSVWMLKSTPVTVTFRGEHDVVVPEVNMNQRWIARLFRD